MLRRVASTLRFSGALLDQLQTSHLVVAVAATTVRYQSSGGWVAPKKRGKTYQEQSTRRPLVNGKEVAFHVNDLKKFRGATTDGDGDTCSSLLGSPASVALTAQQHTQRQQICLQRQRRYESDLIVVLDLDECLVHSQFLRNPIDAAVYAHQLKQEQHQQQQNDHAGVAEPCDSFRVYLVNGELVHVHVRPGLIPFLRHVTSRYETHIFTAGTPIYARPVLDYLCRAVRHSAPPEQDGSIFAGRWYREHCTWDPTRGAYLKDLSKLPLRDIQKTVLVDNNPLSFHANPENGILVNSFYRDGSDDTLSAVTKIIADLEGCPDVRPVLAQRFDLEQAIESQCPQKHLDASVAQFVTAEDNETKSEPPSLGLGQDRLIMDAMRPQIACFA